MKWHRRLRCEERRRSTRPRLRAPLLAPGPAFWTLGSNPESLSGAARARQRVNLPAQSLGLFRCELICLCRPAVRQVSVAAQIPVSYGIELTPRHRWRAEFQRSRTRLRTRVRVGCVSCREEKVLRPDARTPPEFC